MNQCSSGTCITSSSFAGNDELVAVEDSIDVGNVLWIFLDCLCQKLSGSIKVTRWEHKYNVFPWQMWKNDSDTNTCDYIKVISGGPRCTIPIPVEAFNFWIHVLGTPLNLYQNLAYAETPMILKLLCILSWFYLQDTSMTAIPSLKYQKLSAFYNMYAFRWSKCKITR